MARGWDILSTVSQRVAPKLVDFWLYQHDINICIGVITTNLEPLTKIGNWNFGAACLWPECWTSWLGPHNLEIHYPLMILSAVRQNCACRESKTDIVLTVVQGKNTGDWTCMCCLQSTTTWWGALQKPGSGWQGGYREPTRGVEGSCQSARRW